MEGPPFDRGDKKLLLLEVRRHGRREFMVGKQGFGPCKEGLFGLREIRMHLNAFYRAFHAAHGSLIKADTFGTNQGIDDAGVILNVF